MIMVKDSSIEAVLELTSASLLRFQQAEKLIGLQRDAARKEAENLLGNAVFRLIQIKEGRDVQAKADIG